MRNPFTRFVWLVVFFIAILAIGVARSLADVSEPAASGVGVTAAADSGAGLAAAPSVFVARVGNGNAAPWQALLAILIPLGIAFVKSNVAIPDRYRKWIPVVAPFLGELVAQLVPQLGLPNGAGAVAGLAAVGVREIKDQHLPGMTNDENPNDKGNPNSKGGNPNGIVTGLGMAFVFAAGLLLFCGSLAGCARLDPKGIYHGDKVAYDVDATIDGAYSALDSFVQWHRANAVIVDAKWPEIAAFARQLEGGEGDQWVDDTLDLRDAYTKNPSAENRTALDRAVAVLTTALAKAAVYQARLAGGK